MTKGTDRRQATTDSLVGAAEIVPVLPPAPQMQVPNTAAPNVVNSASAQLNRSISQWAGSKFQERANVEHEAALFEGEMAFLQGRTFEDLEMEGDRWALQGYRVMDAEARSATMLAAQQNAIRNGDYAMSAEQYRDTYVNRLEQQLEGLDPQTAEMVRKQMYGHMPTLVRQQTAAHAQHLEQRSYNSLVNAINPVSGDPAALDSFVSMITGGEGSPSAGLSPDRRVAAVVQGVTEALEDGNPVPYQLAMEAGALDAMPRAARERLESANASYQTETRRTYDAAFNAAQQDLERRIAAGDFESPQSAVDAYAELFGTRGLNLTAAEAARAYSGAQQAIDAETRSDVLAIQAATARGDMATLANLTSELSTFHQSGTNLTVFGTIGPDGRMQITPAPPADPGLGIRPSDGSARENARVGREYWRALVSGSSADASLNWDAGDVEAAAIAQSAGVAVANAWIASGRDNSTLPRYTREFAENMVASASGEDLYYTAAERLSMADSELTAAQRVRDNLDAQRDLAAEHQYSLDFSALQADLNAGLISGNEFQAREAALRNEHGVAMTAGISRQIVSAVEAGATAARTRADEQADTDLANAMEQFRIDATQASTALQTANAVPGVSVDNILENQQEYLSYVAERASQLGLQLHETNFSSLLSQANRQTTSAIDASRKYAAEQALIDNAAARGIVDTLSPELQRRHFDQQAEQAQGLVSNAVASGALPEEQANGALEQALTAGWIEAGTVPTEVRNHATAIMGREFAPNGQPNADAVSVLTQWAALRESNPDVAATMLNESAQLRAEAVLAAAGGSFASPDAIATALVAAQRQVDGDAALISGDVMVDQERMLREALDATDAFFSQENVGMLQGIFSSNALVSQRFDRLSSEEDVVFSEKANELLGAQIFQESMRLRNLSPGQTADFYVERAAQNVLDRTSIVGESILVMDEGFSLKDQMFGDNAGTMVMAGIEQRVITEALKDLARADPDNYGFIGDVTFAETARGVGLALAGADVVAGLFGGEVATPELTPSEATEVVLRGVRPFVVETFDNQNIGIRVRLPDGNLSAYIPLDLRAAGERHRQNLLAKLRNN